MVNYDWLKSKSEYSKPWRPAPRPAPKVTEAHSEYAARELANPRTDKSNTMIWFDGERGENQKRATRRFHGEELKSGGNGTAAFDALVCVGS